MAGEAQVYRPGGETETFQGVENVIVSPDGRNVALEDADGNVIAVVIDMPVIVRNLED